MLTTWFKFAVIGLSIVLAACGGSSSGGDGNSEPTSEPQPGLSLSAQSITEGDSSQTLEFIITLDSASTQTISVDIASVDVTAEAGSDYLAIDETLAIPSGELSTTFSLTIIGDTEVEDDERFNLVLSNAVNVDINTTTIPVTITNDDNAIIPAISINDQTVEEGNTDNQQVQFVLFLSEASNQPVSVDISTENVSAQAGSDFIALTETITVPSGETSALITVDIVGDTLVEADEVFALLLSNPINATIDDNRALATITNDDVDGIPIDTPNWREDLLPTVDPIDEDDVVRTSGSSRLIELPNDLHRFWLWVPDTYDESKPAGLMVYIHGSYNGQDDINQWFHNTGTTFRDENLIWIKMSFRDNARPEQSHMDSIRYAIAKTAATYKVQLGHGILTGFSRGGTAMSYWVNQYEGWPFNHILMESGLYQTSLPTTLTPMSWSFSAGELEWGDFNIGNSASTAMAELVNRFDDGGSMDIQLHIINDSGHNPDLAPNVMSSTLAAYQRSRTFRTPFVYRPDFSEAELTNIVNSAQALKLGNAIRHAEALLDNTTDATLVSKTQQLITLINERVDEMYSALNQLATTDPVLAEHYAIVATGQLSGHLREDEFNQLLLNLLAESDFTEQKNVSLQWYDEFLSYLIPNTATLDSDSVNTVQNIVNTLPSSAVVANMGEEFLLLE